MISSGIAEIRPKAVVFIATEILAESSSDFSAGLAWATAAIGLYALADYGRLAVRHADTSPD